ncbi:MAG: hypothetical protein F6J97_23320, partial [Leptolyngbya sp. SIO4C1]|nr:hypothetical protein [Leptolyngbya sp. SIO4C1]
MPRVRLPDNFVERPEAMQAVKEKLLAEDDRTLVVSAISGLGGLGKSVLATALVLDPEVQARFDDGILWVTLGQNPDLLTSLGGWIRKLDKSRESFSANTVEAASQYLDSLLAERRMLLVVDDVWNAAHAEWFRVGSADCRVLVTTREAVIPGAERYDLDLMSPPEALELVRRELGAKWTDDMEWPALEFARLLGYLPLAIRLMAVQVARGRRWETLKKAFLKETKRLKTLDQPGVRLSELSDEERRQYSLRACFALSLDRLKEDSLEQFERFVWLGVLPEDVTIQQRMAMTLWDVEDWEAEETLLTLYERSFLTSGVTTFEGEQTYRIHDLMHDTARGLIRQGTLNLPHPPHLPHLPLAHQHLLTRYRQHSPTQTWNALPNDGYIYRYLTWHMEQADWADEVHALMAMSDEHGRNAWFEACDRIGQPSIFVEDVARGWRLAEESYEQDNCCSIVFQCRYALITATLNSLTGNLPIGLMAEFVKRGFWTVEQAWAYVEQIQSDQKIFEAIGIFAPCLPKSLFQAAARKAQTVQNKHWQALMLGQLARLDAADFSMLLAAARTIQDEYWQAFALSLLAKVNIAIFSEALAAARAIQDEFSRAVALCGLTTIDADIFSEALIAARVIQDESSRASVLGQLAVVNATIFSEALTAAQAIQDEFSRASALGDLAKVDTIVFPEALAAAWAIQDEFKRGFVLSALAEVDVAVFPEALAAMQAIQNEGSRATILRQLAEVEAADFSELLAAAQAIRDEHWRAFALEALVRIEAADFSELLAATRTIQDEYKRAPVLSALAKIDTAIFSEALAAALANARQCSSRIAWAAANSSEKSAASTSA